MDVLNAWSIYLKKCLKLFGWFFLLVLIAVFILLVLALQTKPLVVSSYTVTPGTAQSAEQLALRMHRAYNNTELTITADEANALIAIARRLYPTVHGRVNIGNQQLLAAASVPLVQDKLYLNVSVLLLPSKKGLAVHEVRVGQLRVSGALTLKMAEWIGNRYLPPEGATQLLAAIQEVSFQQDELWVRYQLPEQFQPDQVVRLRDQWQPYGDPKHIQHYYQLLAQHKADSLVLSDYLQVLFTEAAYRSQHQGSAVAENQAALLALGVFFGTSKLELLLGDVRQNSHYASSPPRVTLAGRLDLQQHFVYSAVIKTLTNKNIGFLAGEMKELLDANPGGSGFSFVDLLADMAGVRFAEIALQSEKSARALQQIIVDNGLNDIDLLPDFSTLPEGLYYDAFRDNFDTVESEQYQLMLKHINQALIELPVYRLLNAE
ncbi:hypothetical protein QWY20_03005 [Alkalimonas sp. MEB108]|uniref:Uncharacterized protein n=1 Tax=Alkalimonas cellulosilytica TaxID=3058395 RepID=A0ABU7J318_9GAMM|nr:hypothetical protein [Alkalimonas sp. MEB108]MEE2000410.1 hypothetical protein [Alkalimonas sp. MEB108]